MAASPAWLADLAHDVISHMTPADVLAPIGCHHYYNEPAGQWEITIFVARTETIGGPQDGRMTLSAFHFDVLAMIDAFDHVESVQWQALQCGPDDDLGPHLSMEGTYRGHSLWLRVLASAPEQFEAGRHYHANEMRLVEVW